MAGEKFTFQIQKDELKRIKRAAESRNMSASEFVRASCKEKIEAQSTVLPMLSETRDELGSRMTELERTIKTNCAVLERAQEDMNAELTQRLIDGTVASFVDLKERLAVEFDTTKAWRFTVIETVRDALNAHTAWVESMLAAQAETMGKSYKRLKRIDDEIQKQAGSSWSKKLGDAIAKPKS